MTEPGKSVSVDGRASIPNSPVPSPSPRSKGRPPGRALILNSCVAAGSLELGMSYSPLSILRAQLGRGRAARTGLRLGRITPHGVQARGPPHLGALAKPLVAQALVKPCAIAIAGLQIGGQALAV